MYIFKQFAAKLCGAMHFKWKMKNNGNDENESEINCNQLKNSHNFV